MQQPPTKRSIYCRLQNMEMKETYNPKIGSPSICAMLAFGWNIFLKRILFYVTLNQMHGRQWTSPKSQPCNDQKTHPASITKWPRGHSPWTRFCPFLTTYLYMDIFLSWTWTKKDIFEPPTDLSVHLVTDNPQVCSWCSLFSSWQISFPIHFLNWPIIYCIFKKIFISCTKITIHFQKIYCPIVLRIVFCIDSAFGNMILRW